MDHNADAFWRSHFKMRHLRMLTALDEHRHVGRAADALYVSQPAVSRTLAEIETGLGLRLFDRTPAGLVPTPYGERLIEYARHLEIEMFRAREDLKAMDYAAV